jgi:hypothetical protein
MVYTSINKDLLLRDVETKILPNTTNLIDGNNEIQNDNTTEQTINTPLICTKSEDHKIKWLVVKENPNWCKPNGMFAGACCQGKSCGLKFVHKIENPAEEFKASVRKPMHVCPNEVNQCTFAYCHECFQKLFRETNNE